jgi:hypothetical protein
VSRTKTALRSRFSLKLLLTFGLVILADWLFYDQLYLPGCTVGLFFMALFAAMLTVHKNLLRTRNGKLVTLLILLLLLKMIDAPSVLTTCMLCIGFIVLLVLPRRTTLKATGTAKDIFSLFTRGLFQLHKDTKRVRHITKKGRGSINLAVALPYFILPSFLTIIFICFFSAANPIFAKAFDWIDLKRLKDIFAFNRVIFWTLTAVATWIFLRPHLRPKQIEETPRLSADLDRWLSASSITISLCVFNVLFAVQNALDIEFLWSGRRLPDGLNYAEYAHSGAYALIFTVILAALYVLLVFDDERKKYQTAITRKLTLLWIGQNIFLTISAINRTIHYVDTYSLTYLRLSALIWMGIIATGLLLIITKISRNKSSTWLFNSNSLIVLIVLYACCYLNLSRIISDYNAKHSREVTKAGPPLDLDYMYELGPEALPAIMWFKDHASMQEYQKKSTDSLISSLTYMLKDSMGMDAGELPWKAWRHWTWRSYRTLAEINKLEEQGKVEDITVKLP